MLVAKPQPTNSQSILQIGQLYMACRHPRRHGVKEFGRCSVDVRRWREEINSIHSETRAFHGAFKPWLGSLLNHARDSVVSEKVVDVPEPISAKK